MVSFSELSTSTWDVMYAHLQTGTYAISTNNIFSAWNDELIADKGFPIVIIRPALLSIKSITINGSVKKAEVKYQIDIYHKTSQAMKVQVDEVINKLIIGYNVFAAARLKKVKDDWFSTINYTSWRLGETQRVHMYSLEINYTFVD